MNLETNPYKELKIITYSRSYESSYLHTSMKMLPLPFWSVMTIIVEKPITRIYSVLVATVNSRVRDSGGVAFTGLLQHAQFNAKSI